MAPNKATTKPAETATADTDNDIFDVLAGDLVSSGGGDSDAYKPENGIHQATCVAVVYFGEVENKFKPGSKQKKCQLLFALNDQNVVFKKDDGTEEDTGEPITVLSKHYTVSFHEKAGLTKDCLAMGFKVDPAKTTVASFLGMKCQLIVSRNDEDQVVVNVAPPSKNQANPENPVYLPNFWLVDKATQQPTGYKIRKMDDLVHPEARPKHEA